MFKFKTKNSSGNIGNTIFGFNCKTRKPVTLSLPDRSMNTVVWDSNITSRLENIAYPVLEQDLKNMRIFHVSYPDHINGDDSREIRQNLLRGISVISPSGDLCANAIRMARDIGIPEHAITYINAGEETTKKINLLLGPVEEVAELFSQILTGLNNKGGAIFGEIQRDHLKHYIYLLKLHNPEQEVTFDMLLDMYNNPQLVHLMHLQLKKAYLDDVPRDYWPVVQETDRWFDLYMMRSATMTTISEWNGESEHLYYDSQEKHVQGLRKMLNEIGADPQFRRVFGISRFDIDFHVRFGGLLVVNTGNEESSIFSHVIGKLVLFRLQQGILRYHPNHFSTYHHILVDEADNYLHRSFIELSVLSRRFRTILTLFLNSYPDIENQQDRSFMVNLTGTIRNHFISRMYAESRPVLEPFVGPVLSANVSQLDPKRHFDYYANCNFGNMQSFILLKR